MSKALKSPRAIPVSSDLREELEHWRFLDSWSGFLPWKDEKHFQLTVFSDASKSGWGGILRLPGQPQQEFRGHWDLHEGDLPIIVKEALALLFVLQRVARQTLGLIVSSIMHPWLLAGKKMALGTPASTTF